MNKLTPKQGQSIVAIMWVLITIVPIILGAVVKVPTFAAIGGFFTLLFILSKINEHKN